MIYYIFKRKVKVKLKEKEKEKKLRLLYLLFFKVTVRHYGGMFGGRLMNYLVEFYFNFHYYFMLH